MTHERAQPLLLDLVYGELSPDEAQEVERHAADCAPCAAELEGLLATRRLAARLADAPVPARGRAELLALARRAVAPPPPRRRVRARAYAVVASAAVVVLVAGLTLRLSDQRSVLKGREVPDLHDLTPLEDVAPPAVPGPVAKPPSPQPSPLKGEGAERAAPPPSPERAAPPARKLPPARDARPSRAAAPERSPSAPRSDSAAERKSAPTPPAAEPPSPARAERPSAGASPQPFAAAPQRPAAPKSSAAPQRSAAPRAQEVERFAQPTQAPAAASAPQSIVDDIERRAADGQLRQERRRLSCDGVSVERMALLDGARVVKLTIRTDDGTVHEGWYDEAGRLQTERRSAPRRPAELPSEGEGADEAAPAPSLTLPSWAPAPAALPRCGW